MWMFGFVYLHICIFKDGAFVVRDSSKGSVEHPFTLMLLYQDKVYNIKIRHQGNGYTLGNGLKNTKVNWKQRQRNVKKKKNQHARLK